MTISPIRTHDSTFRDYWILDEGILEVKITSAGLLIVIWAFPTLILGIIGIYLYPGLGQLVYALALAWAISLTVLYYRRAKHVRMTLYERPVESVRGDVVSSTLYPWSDIIDLQFVNLSLNFRTSNKSFRSKVEKADLQTAVQIATSKLGKSVISTERYR